MVRWNIINTRWPEHPHLLILQYKGHPPGILSTDSSHGILPGHIPYLHYLYVYGPVTPPTSRYPQEFFCRVRIRQVYDASAVIVIDSSTLVTISVQTQLVVSPCFRLNSTQCFRIDSTHSFWLELTQICFSIRLIFNVFISDSSHIIQVAFSQASGSKPVSRVS